MPRGIIASLVHLSQQPSVASTRLIAAHNDKGYGFLIDDQKQQIYFSHEMVVGHQGFDLLRQGMLVDFVRDSSPYLCATSVQQVPAESRERADGVEPDERA